MFDRFTGSISVPVSSEFLQSRLEIPQIFIADSLRISKSAIHVSVIQRQPRLGIGKRLVIISRLHLTDCHLIINGCLTCLSWPSGLFKSLAGAFIVAESFQGKPQKNPGVFIPFRLRHRLEGISRLLIIAEEIICRAHTLLILCTDGAMATAVSRYVLPSSSYPPSDKSLYMVT